MKHPEVFYKEVDGKIEWTHSEAISIKNIWVSNPTEEEIEEDGWERVSPQDPVLYQGDDFLPEPENILEFKKYFSELRRVFNPTFNCVVYHYTTWDILFSKIMSRESIDNSRIILRAYCINYMNDTLEHKLMVFKQMEAEKPLSPNREKLWKQSAEEGKNEWFATCFSKEEDSLPMWNYYGLNGRGVALGLDANEIWKQGFLLYDCIYSKEDIEELASKHYIGVTIPESDPLNKNPFREPIYLRCLAKDKHFAYEKECRILLYRFGNQYLIKSRRDQFYPIEFGMKGGLIVPFVDIMLPLSSVKKIIIGPTNNTERAQQSLKSWLEYHDLDQAIQVKLSSAPIAKD